jgi:ubiquinone/menaquinone biosynthesis C-methylase UbiE
MNLAQSRAHWEDLGSLDPYWAILSEPGKRNGRWNVDEFFATGESEISTLMSIARTLGIPRQFDRALDFGCGIGRLSCALASRFDSVNGIDISQSMISQAANLMKNRNCSFVVNSSGNLPFRSRSFDLVLSTIVLQHVPDQNLIRNYIGEFARVLKPGGLLAFQLPSYIPPRRRVQLRPRLYNFLRNAGLSQTALYRHLRLHPIPMNFLPENEVYSVLQRNQCEIVKTVSDDRAGEYIESHTYFATKH